ncbi:hypothetical protein SLE2022_006220 [Rubroshorea leprosula]
MLKTHKPDVICFMETKADSTSSALGFMPRFGYDKQFQVPASGFAGGLWLFWKSSGVHLSVLSSSAQVIHCSVDYNAKNYLLSLVYVRPQAHFKESFWNDIESRSLTNTVSWVLMGDFNEIMSADEVFPRHSATFQRASRFRQILDNYNLFSEDALGCKFSWCRIQHGRVMLRERLDRVLFNAQAKVQFQGAKLINLPRTCSDHHPILLNLDTAASQPPPYKPRCFEAVWLTREEFSKVFSQAWGQYPLDMKAAIENTSSACMSWGREVFGNIFRRKRLLRARIAGIQNSPSYGSSAPL